ncbi:MAG: hypothetical protein V3V08_18555 [Nannocystaceae bacterium]
MPLPTTTTPLPTRRSCGASGGARTSTVLAFTVAFTFASGCSKKGEDGPSWGGGGSPETALIDDLDDGDGQIAEVGGRRGAWYVYNDVADGLSPGAQQVPPAGGDFLPASGGAEGSAFCAQTSGSGFGSWGAGIGVDLNDDGEGEKHAFDASGYTGIRFMARGNTEIRFSGMIASVLPVADGGSCQAGPEAACYDAHGTKITLGSEWQQYSIPFSQLLQEGWGAVQAFAPGELMGLQFQVATGVAFEFSIDSLHFD